MHSTLGTLPALAAFAFASLAAFALAGIRVIPIMCSAIIRLGPAGCRNVSPHAALEAIDAMVDCLGYFGLG